MTAHDLSAWLGAAKQALSSSPTPMLDARVLACAALGLDEAGLIARDQEALSADDRARLDAFLRRRAAGEPVAYIVGEKEFWGLRLKVRAPALIPRPDSETLIEAAVERIDAAAPLSILDLGTGSGALLAALLSHFSQAWGVGVDKNPAAVALASENFAALGLSARSSAQRGDWGEGLSGPFDLIVSNPPYIADGEAPILSQDILAHEDHEALFAGRDGLAAYRRIIPELPRLIARRGLILLEIGADLASSVCRLVKTSFPEAAVSVRVDLAGRPRVVIVDPWPQKND